MMHDVFTRDRTELSRLARRPGPTAPPEEQLRFAQAVVLLRAHFGDTPGVEQIVTEVTTRLIEGANAPALVGSALVTRGFARYVLLYDWQGARQDFDAAAGRGADPLLHLWYADFLTAVDCHDKAIAEIEQARWNTPIVERDRARARYFARQYDEAIDILASLLQREPGFAPARSLLGRAYVLVGTPERGIAELRRAGRGYEAMLACACAHAGLRDDAERILGSLVTSPSTHGILPYEIAVVYAALRRNDEALTWLRIAFEDRDPSMTDLLTDPFLDDLRNDDRCRTLVRDVGFPLVLN